MNKDIEALHANVYVQNLEARIVLLETLVWDMCKTLEQEDINGRMFIRDGKVVFESWEDRLHELGIEVNQ